MNPRSNDYESQAREIAAEAETSEQARDDLFEQVPEGWMIIGGIDVDPADTYQLPH
ncbi:hypothetical protein APR04_005702 [Promicromonospora umidemergens]|uniref:Uncharacterized protein n=1 Tax=Promicromonospora umidemergens TaxID=629679 RepID=A0ABP8XZX7_9MICO|nr:hypothetical protein [Promicromonospora umidemergens]MCP2286762.1 hypothetical protein [Promicromonospora umidemergens]